MIVLGNAVVGILEIDNIEGRRLRGDSMIWTILISRDDCEELLDVSEEQQQLRPGLTCALQAVLTGHSKFYFRSSCIDRLSDE